MFITPEILFKNVEAIHPDYLHAEGITALVLDVDNTLTGDGSQELQPSVRQWLDDMQAAGIQLMILSNNTPKRVLTYTKKIGLPGFPMAMKPLPIGLWVIRFKMGIPRKNMAMVGDQLFTDRLAAALFGCRCLSVLPRTNYEKSRGVRFKRKLEPHFIQKYYDRGGILHE